MRRSAFTLALWLVACGGDRDPVDGCPTWYPDGDGDGFGDARAGGVAACSAPRGHVDNALDCDDTQRAIHPGAVEVCDPADRDEDCNGLADNDDPAFTGGTVEAWPDADGDGYVDGRVEPTVWCDLPEGWSTEAFLTDCDDADPATYPGAAHQEAPVACMTDADGDGWGDRAPAPGVAPGSDCDDADPATHPRAIDDTFDGVDQNCDRLDGPTLADDFELAGPDPAVWAHVSGSLAPSITTVGQGNVSLDVFGTGGRLESVPLDTSGCSAIVWHYLGHQPAVPNEAPDPGDWLHLEYWDGGTWLTLNAWEGGLADATWHVRYGTLAAPSALHPDFRVRFRGAAKTASDHFYVDDFWLGCSADGDGDGVPDPLDCAPEDAHRWSDCGQCVDADGDGYGAGCDRGPDCDDADPAVHPFAPDPLGDGRDTDCSGRDGRGFHEDFEGEFLGSRWTADAGAGQRVYVAEDRHVSGRRAVRVEGTGIVTRAPVDLGACDTWIWEYQGKRGPSAPEVDDALSLEVRTASGWIAADTWAGGATDLTFVLRRGWFAAPDLDGTNFQLRFRGHPGGQADDDWYIDDLRVHCATDGDGDGVPDAFDCDVGDPNHWADCGRCVDADGDGYGTDCDLGPDCDDGDAAVHPTAPDGSGDGVDGDCDGLDGLPLVFDDFEPLGPDPGVWAAVTGNVASTAVHVGEGARSMDFFGAGGLLESGSVDTSACALVAWSYLGMIGGAGPADPGDYLFLEYWDGTSWRVADRYEGGTGDLGVWKRRSGFVADAAARHPSFRVRLRGQSSGNNDHFYVDRVEVGCGAADNDGDGVPRGVDCDDTDPWHASDCDRCIDGDGDGFGTFCDFGPDCDDADPNVHPLASDPTRDGFDQDCDFFDGPGVLFDDFELGEPDPAVWAGVTGNVATTSAWAAEGTWAVDLFGRGGMLETHPYDLSTCPAVAWSYAVMNGGAGAAEASDWLYLERWDGAAWREVDRWNGAGAAQDVWHTRTGVILHPTAARPDFRLRLRGDADTDLDHFYVDRVEAGCTAADLDGDGVPGGLDCDDGDPRHHADCGVCQDLDGDGYGSRCDLGEDCDDLDAAIHPGAPDEDRDGVDQDCDGMDGAPLLFDDFDAHAGPDPSAWTAMSGNAVALDDPSGRRGTVVDFWGAGGVLESRPFDTSSCPQVVWRYAGATGGADAADTGDWLFLDYWDGTAWVAVATWEGGRDLDAWHERSGVLTVPGALHAGFRIRLRGEANATNDHFHVDAVRVGCAAPDGDGDHHPRHMDCDDDDFWHWSDCGTCIDVDGDGYGPGCDLGGDCDDTDPTVNPAMPDPKDGFDANCDSLDVALLADGFDAGGPDPALWAAWSGTVVPSAGWRGDVDYTMDFAHNTGVLETVPIDTTSCATIGWRFVGMSRSASSSDALIVEYWNGLGWIPATTWYGSLDGGWADFQGAIHDPNAYRPDFAFRIRGRAQLATRHFHVDEVAVGCLD